MILVDVQVKPALRDKVGECLLRELVKRWAIHRVMVTSLSYFFEYVDRYYLESRGFPSVNEVGISCFPNLVSDSMHPHPFP